MDFFRKIGIGIVMIVPTFVGAGAVWDLFHHSWPAVFVWFLFMIVVVGGVVSGKVLPSWESGEFRFG